MASIRLQGEAEALRGIYYEYDPESIPVGRGGTGVVYCGTGVNTITGERFKVAIKVLHDDIHPSIVARSRREASLSFRSANLIEMYGFIEAPVTDRGGTTVRRYHIISEFISGVSLKNLVNGQICDSSGHVIPLIQELNNLYRHNRVDFAVTIAGGVLEALKVLHSYGFIHRDIDPSNIIITESGIIKLIDLGIIRRFAGAQDDSRLTMPGGFVGKPRYASPELVKGILDAQTPPTDIYAVGILIYQLVTGELPFEGDMDEIMRKQVGAPMPVGNISHKGLRAIVKKATAKDRARRYQNADEMLAALAACDHPAKPSKPLMKIAGVTAGAVIAVALAFVVLRGGDGPALPLPLPDSVRTDQEYTKPVSERAEDLRQYHHAVDLLGAKSTAAEGMKLLKQLADRKVPAAMFMLSRLYFQSRESVYTGALNDSVERFRRNVSVPVDNRRAHQLLLSTVQCDRFNYRALFELGCNYKSRLRGAPFNTDSAYFYLQRAKAEADAAGDQIYVKAARDRLVNMSPRNL